MFKYYMVISEKKKKFCIYCKSTYTFVHVLIFSKTYPMLIFTLILTFDAGLFDGMLFGIVAQNDHIK